MAIQTNPKGISHAKGLIKAGKVDKTSSWSFDADDGNKILNDGGWSEYAKWFLAIDTDADEETKERYKFPFGKNGKVYRRGVIAAKQRAAQQGYDSVMKAADELLSMIDKDEEGDRGMKKIRMGMQFRSYEIRNEDIDRENRLLALSFSSEEPVERFFGYEILDHSPEAVDLARLRRGGALLIDHDPRDQVGVIEKVFVSPADRKGRAIVRFGRSAKAEEIFQDVLDGIRKNSSVGYLIKEMRLEEKREDADVYRVTKWQPFEISLVSIPADVTVGIGREMERDVTVIMPEQEQEDKKEETEKERQITGGNNMEEIKIDVNKVREEAKKAEQQRVAEIMAIAEKHNCRELATKAISEGTSVEDFKGIVLEHVYNARKVNIDANIGMSDKEVKEYRILRAINAMLHHDWSKAPFEKEASDAVAKRLGKQPQGFFVPYDVLTRDLAKSGGSGQYGGYTVATELLASQFIEMLRNKMLVRQLGARILGGLVGDIAIPKQAGGATGYWVSEGNTPTESTQTFGQVPLTPKTVGTYTDITRKLLLQSSIDVEAFVRADLATTLALAIDAACLTGSSASGQPTGIINTSGIGVVWCHTSGDSGTGDYPAWGDIVDLETEVAVDNADIGALAYLTNAKVRGYLKKTLITASINSTNTYGETMVWQKSDRPGVGDLNGYYAYVSNQVPSNLTTSGDGSNLSAIFFGNWSDLIIGEWGALDILIDPYTGGAAGTVRVRVLQDVDVAVRHLESFAVIKDAKT